MDAEIEKTGRVIFYAREMEAALRRLGAEGAGLGELTADARRILPESMLRDLHFVIGVRNRTAHESNGFPADVDFDSFDSICQQLLRRFEQLQRVREDAAGTEPTPPELEELEEWRRQVASRLRISGCLPLFNWFYFLVLVCSAVYRSFGVFVMLLLQLLAIPLVYEWRDSGVDIYGIAGGGLWAGAYGFSLVAMWAKRRDGEARISWCWFLPGLNFLYLANVWRTQVRWWRLIAGLTGLWLDFWALAMAFHGDWLHFLTGMGMAYVLGLIALVIWGRASRQSGAGK